MMDSSFNCCSTPDRSTRLTMKALWKSEFQDQLKMVFRVLKKCKRASIGHKRLMVCELMQFAIDRNIQDCTSMLALITTALECIKESKHRIIYPMESQKVLCELTYDDFFFEHSNTGRLKIVGARLPDLLLGMFREQSYYGMDCETLSRLLRYGTLDMVSYPNFGDEDVMNEDGPPVRKFGSVSIPPYPLLDLMAHLLSKLYRHGVRGKMKRKLNEKFKGYVEMMAVATRACGKLPRRNIAICNGKKFQLKLTNLEVSHVVTLFALPRETSPIKNGTEIQERISGDVPSLTHLCRVTIRKCLYSNWNLPGGIKHLGLPRKLENYLDLES